MRELRPSQMKTDPHLRLKLQDSTPIPRQKPRAATLVCRTGHLLLGGTHSACAGLGSHTCLLRSTISPNVIELTLHGAHLFHTNLVVLHARLLAISSSRDCAHASARRSRLRASTVHYVLPAPDPRDSPAHSPRRSCPGPAALLHTLHRRFLLA